MTRNSSSDRPAVPDIRRALGRGHMRPGTIEQAEHPRQALGRLAMYLQPYKAALALVLLCVLVYILLQLLAPYLLGRAIDKYISTRQIAGLSTLALALLGAYVFNSVFQAIAAWLMAKISQDALKTLRQGSK